MKPILATLAVWIVAEVSFLCFSRRSRIRALALRGAVKNGIRVLLWGKPEKHVLCRIVKHQPRRER